MKPVRKLPLIGSICLFVIFAAVLHWSPKYTPLRDGNRYRPQEWRFLDSDMQQYALKHDGWFPRGEGPPLNVLVDTLMPLDPYILTALTTPRHRAAAYEWWDKHGSVNPNLSYLHYNPGLNLKDPPDLLVLYAPETRPFLETFQFRPIQVPKLEGNPPVHLVMTVGHEWVLLTESEYRFAQKKTQDYLSQREERAGDIRWFQEYCSLGISSEEIEPGVYKIEVHINNLSKESVKLSIEYLSFLLWDQNIPKGTLIEVPGRGSYLVPQTWYWLKKYRMGTDSYTLEQDFLPEKLWKRRKTRTHTFRIRQNDVIERLKDDSYLTLSGRLELSSSDRLPILVNFEQEKYLKPEFVKETKADSN